MSCKASYRRDHAPPIINNPSDVSLVGLKIVLKTEETGSTKRIIVSALEDQIPRRLYE
jgi:hypothetical protein